MTATPRNRQDRQRGSLFGSSQPQISPVVRVVFINNTVVSAEHLLRDANIPIGITLSVTMISEAIGRIESAHGDADRLHPAVGQSF